jgi:hypothetical protein
VARRSMADEEVDQTPKHVIGSEPSRNDDRQAPPRELVKAPVIAIVLPGVTSRLASKIRRQATNIIHQAIDLDQFELLELPFSST